MRIEVGKRTTEVTESDRQAWRSKTDVSELANELMHLGAAIGPLLRDGCPHWRIGKRWTDHGGATMDPEHHGECDPEHPDESESEKLEKLMNQNKQCSGLMQSSPNGE